MTNLPATTQPPAGELVQRTPQQELISQIRSEQFLSQAQMALPEGLTPERFVRATVTAVMQEPKLAQVEPDSLFASVIRCATDGLLPDGREAALVIYGSKAQYLPMIGGYRKIAAEHGWTLRTAVVHANDEFEHEQGLEPKLVHRPVRPGADRGQPIAAYAAARHRDGRSEFVVMYADEIEKVRQSSRAKDSGPWRDWPMRMWEKTAGRRLFKELPLDPGDRRVASILEAADSPAGAQILYGQHAQLPAGTPDSYRADDGSAAGGTAATVAQQADTDTTTDPPSGPPVSVSAPEPQLDTHPLPDADTVDHALQQVVPSGPKAGMTLDAIAENPRGKTWLEWATGPDGQQAFPDDFRRHCHVVLAARYGVPA